MRNTDLKWDLFKLHIFFIFFLLLLKIHELTIKILHLDNKYISIWQIPEYLLTLLYHFKDQVGEENIIKPKLQQ